MGEILFYLAAGVALLVLNWSTVKSAASWAVGLVTTKPAAGALAVTRPVAQANLDSVIAYFKTESCPEGEDAARAVGVHFYHPHKPDQAAV